MEGGGGAGDGNSGAMGAGGPRKTPGSIEGGSVKKREKKFTTLYNILEEEMYKEGGTT